MARSFNGSSDYAQNGAAVISAPPFTLSAWVYVTSDVAQGSIISISDTALGNSYYQLAYRGAAAGNPVAAIARDSGTFEACVSTTGVTLNTWVHVAAVFASATSRAVYLNGGSKGTSSTSFSPAGLDVTTVGRLSRNTGVDYFPGLIAVPCIHAAALSDDEVAQLAASFLPTMVRPDAIVALWEFDQGASPEPDRSGGYSLTLSGTSQVDDPPLIYPAGVLSVVQGAGGGGGGSGGSLTRSKLLTNGLLIGGRLAT